MAHSVRAILLASATAASLFGLRASRLSSQGERPSVARAERGIRRTAGTCRLAPRFRLRRSGRWDGGRDETNMPDSTPPRVEIDIEPSGSEASSELRTIFLGGLLLLALLAACYVAAEIILP